MASTTNTAPVAAFTVTLPNGASKSIDVNGSTSTDDKAVVYWAWNYGDGTTNTGVAPSRKKYATSGTYPVTLTVTDA